MDQSKTNKNNRRGKLNHQQRRILSGQRRGAEKAEIQALEQRIEAEKPPSGINPLVYDDINPDANKASSNNEDGKEKDYSVYYPEAKRFDELPISTRTKEGLSVGRFTMMTEIQRATLPHSLAGRDVLAAAKTGSGKTLAFLIPILEKLYRMNWSAEDGLGALIISPTRELALQIFEVLRTIGAQHTFSAGLVIGGKDFNAEQKRIANMNILVCTPGRLLQHMDQTPLFDCTNLQALVLDEADRILDMGFERTVNSIVENLPSQRQTLLFSATQTKSVKHLARLSLKDPEYISVHEKEETATPKKLQQNYMIVELQDKLNTLYSFIKTHTKSKILVFMSSCKQVRFIYETFRRLQPGLPVMELHGKMKQMKRMAVFVRYCDQQHACLFATDIAARGLDFPGVDWVVQVDCPEDVATYVHRVGRTARYNSGGRALMMLMPSEEKMLDLLKQKKIPIDLIKANPKRRLIIENKLQAFLSQDPTLKFLAQKCFVSYMRSVFLHSNKDVFVVQALPAEKFALSLGLLNTPRIRFTQNKKAEKNVSYQMQQQLAEAEEEQQDGKKFKLQDEDEDTEDKKYKRAQQLSYKVEKLLVRKNANVLSDAYSRLRASVEESDDDEDVLVLKNKGAATAAEKKPSAPAAKTTPKDIPILRTDEVNAKAALHVQKIYEQLREKDKKDKEKQRQLRKEKRWADRQQEKEEATREFMQHEYGAQLAVPASRHKMDRDDNNDDDDESEDSDEAIDFRARNDDEEEEYDDDNDDDDDEEEESARMMGQHKRKRFSHDDAEEEEEGDEENVQFSEDEEEEEMIRREMQRLKGKAEEKPENTTATKAKSAASHKRAKVLEKASTDDLEELALRLLQKDKV